MFYGSVIEELLKEKGISKVKLYTYLNGHAPMLNKIIKKGNPEAKTLEKIADFFGVSIDRFFKREVYSIQNESDAFKMLIDELSKAKQDVGWLKNENERLEKELANKKSGGGFTSLAAEHELDYSKRE